MQLNKIVNLVQLEKEFIAAGVAVNGLGTINDGTEIHTYDKNGTITELPEAAQALIDAHVPDAPSLTSEERISALETLVLQLGGVI